MAATATDWSKLRVVDLKAELKARGLSVAGRKDELVHRLAEADETAADDGGAENDESDEKADVEADADAPAAAEEPPHADVAEAPAAPSLPSADVALELPTVPAESPTEPTAETVEPVKPVEPAEPAGEIAEPVQPAAAEPTTSSPRAPVPADNAPREKTPAPAEPVAPSTAPSSATPALTEVVQDFQKRKRRSVTPPPPPLLSDEEGASARSKRQRLDEDVGALGEAAAPPYAVAREVDVDVDVEPAAHDRDVHPDVHHDVHDHKMDLRPDVDVHDTAAAVPPPVHPPTAALYIRNLMRPLRPSLLEMYTAELAAGDDDFNRAADNPSDFLLRTYLDPIKTHAFVVFRGDTVAAATAAAVRVRAALHGRVWPDERNRRPLWVDFVPPDAVDGWIAQEETAGGDVRGGGGGSRSSLKKWEVVYRTVDEDTAAPDGGGGGGGGVVATLCEVGANGGSPAGAPVGATAAVTDAVPQRSGAWSPPPPEAPRGPRGDRERDHDMAPTDTGGTAYFDRLHTTRAVPPLAVEPVHPDLVRRRQEAFRSWTAGSRGGRTRSPSPRGDYTKTHNRYTFADGDQLVDRGPEQFDGIRPPHRERERAQARGQVPPSGPRTQGWAPRDRRNRRRGGGGGGGGRNDRWYNDEPRPRRDDAWDDRGGGGGGRGGRDDWRDDRRYDDRRGDDWRGGRGGWDNKRGHGDNNNNSRRGWDEWDRRGVERERPAVQGYGNRR